MRCRRGRFAEQFTSLECIMTVSYFLHKPLTITFLDISLDQNTIMGWFSSSSDSKSVVAKPTSDGGYIAPDRKERALCWEGRDAFFACLEQNNIIDSIRQDEKAKKACPKELQMFEKNCAESWVTYFKKRRVMEHQRDLTLKRLEGEGAQGMTSSAAGNGSFGGTPQGR